MPNYAIRAGEALRTRATHHMDHAAFDKLVKQVYGHSFEFASDQGSDTGVYRFVGKKQAVVDVYGEEKRELAEFIATGRKPLFGLLVQTLLQDLVNNEVLPEGDYLIRVW